MTGSRTDAGFDLIDPDTFLADKPAAQEAYWSAGDVLETAALVGRLRRRAKLTVPQLAERVGVDGEMIAAIEDGRAENLSVVLLHHIGRACGATLVTTEAVPEKISGLTVRFGQKAYSKRWKPNNHKSRMHKQAPSTKQPRSV